ncbi:MAG: glycoside hydrolase family 3 protein, partial [Deltaproteobacteria bacterium]|nr:glycoside hydrolase family 3 protein [Deltaproteobacteria bacterium]
VPFREAIAATSSVVMVAHVVVPAVDGEEIASLSPRVIDEVLRGRLGHRGLVITDDLCMAPVSHGPGGIRRGAVAALNAGADLLLVSYDTDQYFEVMDALLEAEREGRLDTKALETSRTRLWAPRAASGTGPRRTPVSQGLAEPKA